LEALVGRANRHTVLALLLVVTPLAIIALKFLQAPASYSNWGDGAAAELGVQRASQFEQLVGPYNRFGWNHPGPSSYYLLALPYRLLGESGRALPLGTAVLNAVALGWIVVLVAKRSNARAAVASAGILCAFQLALTLPHLSDVWNPLMVVTPTALCLVLCASLATGSNWSLPGAIAVASFCIQTHIATAALMIPALVLALSALVISRPWRRSSPRSIRTRTGAAILAITGVIVLAFWLPPVIDQFTSNPGNGTKIARFFRGGNGDHSFSEASASLAKSLLVVPAQRHLGDDVSSGPRAVLFLMVGALTAAAVVRLAWVRRQRLALALSLGATLLAGLALVAFTRVEGPIYGYLVLWASSLSVCFGLALALCLLDPGERAWRPSWIERLPRLGTIPLLTAVVVASGFAVVKALEFNAGAGYVNVNAAADTLSESLQGQRGGVLACIASADAWPSAAGVIANLRKQGRDVRVQSRWLFMLGSQLRPRGTETSAVTFETLTRRPPPFRNPPSSVLLADDLRMYLLRSPGGHVPPTACPATRGGG